MDRKGIRVQRRRGSPNKATGAGRLGRDLLSAFAFIGITLVVFFIISAISAGIVAISPSSNDAAYLAQAVALLSFSVAVFAYLYFQRNRQLMPALIAMIALVDLLIISAEALAVTSGSGALSLLGIPAQYEWAYLFFSAAVLVLLPVAIAVLAHRNGGIYQSGRTAAAGSIRPKRSMLEELGLSRDRFSYTMVLAGLFLAFIIFLFEIGVGALSAVTNTQINTNIGVLIAGAPAWFLVFVAVIEPINEEILFRGLMVPRIGILLSAVIFGIGHASYASTFAIDVIAAFIFGIIAGYAFKKTRSLYPSIIAHIMVNTIGVVFYLLGMNVLLHALA